MEVDWRKSNYAGQIQALIDSTPDLAELNKLQFAFKLGVQVAAEQMVGKHHPEIYKFIKIISEYDPAPVETAPKTPRKLEPTEKILQIAAYIQKNPSHNQQEIAKGLGVSVGTVKRYSKAAKVAAKKMDANKVRFLEWEVGWL